MIVAVEDLCSLPTFVGGLYLNALAQSTFDATVRDAGVDLSLYRHVVDASPGSMGIAACRSLVVTGVVVAILFAAFKDDKQG